MATSDSEKRVTLRTVRRWAAERRPIPMLTCYDATTARWLWRGGIRCVLVGDTAAHVILGHDSTLPARMPFMLEITAAVRRGAPNLFIMADMPFGSYHCGDDEAMRNVMAFITDAGADVVKLEVDASQTSLVRRMASAGVPVVAHLGSRPQQKAVQGRYRTLFEDEASVQALADTARQMADAGAVMLLLEAVPRAAAQRVMAAVAEINPIVPVIGCGAGPDCHGHVVVLHDVLGLSDWHAPFAPPLGELGSRTQQVAEAWVRMIESGSYLRDDHPYH